VDLALGEDARANHVSGVHAFAMLTLGATLVVLPDFDAADVLRAIERHRITHLWLPASALYLLLDCPARSRTDCSSLRSVLLGASAVAPERLKEAVTAFGPCVSVNYAQIEGGFLSWLDAPTVADAAAGNHPERLASSGTTMGVGRLAVMDETGRLLPRGQTGEIVVRGLSVKPYIAKPYIRDEQELAGSQRHGWHHTGDLGQIAPDGYLYVVGRKKDLVITGGFKVSVAEVERVINELPEIGECVVTAVPDAVRGESVKAIVTVRPGRVINATQILTHCRKILGRVHSPVTVEQWTELPKNAGGKVDRQQIRARFWALEDSDEHKQSHDTGSRSDGRGATPQRAEGNLV
jgi:fatty-acyl-CoA synthase